jgi:hypothetical protein
MWGHGFFRSIGFAAVAGLGYFPYALVIVPLVGSARAAALYAVGAAAVYVAGLGADRARALGAALIVGGVGLGLFAVASSLAQVVAGTAVLIALARSGVLFASRPARAFLLEAVLGAAALGLASALFAHSTVSIALSIWGFFLLQSAFFLAGGVRAVSSPTARLDPFDEACARARALMAEDALTP